jgi:hypothetical protein
MPKPGIRQLTLIAALGAALAACQPYGAPLAVPTIEVGAAGASVAGSLVVRPSVDAGYQTLAEVVAYTKGHIDTLKLHLVSIPALDAPEDQETVVRAGDTPVVGVMTQADLDANRTVTFNNLRAGTIYRVKAVAYLADGTTVVSTGGSACWAEVAMDWDAALKALDLKVKLKGQTFAGTATGGVTVTGGTLDHQGTEAVALPANAGLCLDVGTPGAGTGLDVYRTIGNGTEVKDPDRHEIWVPEFYVPDATESTTGQYVLQRYHATTGQHLGSTPWTNPFSQATEVSAVAYHPATQTSMMAYRIGTNLNVRRMRSNYTLVDDGRTVGQVGTSIAIEADPESGGYFIAWTNGKTVHTRLVGPTAADDRPPTTLVTSPDNVQGLCLAYDPDRRRFLVSWIQMSAGAQTLHARLVNPDGTPMGPSATRLSNATGYVVAPTLAYDAAHQEFLVAYNHMPTNPGTVKPHLQRVGPDGWPYGPATVLTAPMMHVYYDGAAQLYRGVTSNSSITTRPIRLVACP